LERGEGQSSELGLHEQLQDEEKKPHEFSECGKSFVLSSQLDQKIHTWEQVGSEVEKPNLDQGQRSELGLHEQLQDEEEKPHRCSECGEIFVLSSHLVAHLRNHTGEQLGSEGEKPNLDQ
ncbi:ZN429 protein, partial [Calcarius ornatus]|nr:ZN429 protein [Calcarius ornatus]